jgi:hypothetical protein
MPNRKRPSKFADSELERWSSHLMPEQRGLIEIGVSREEVWDKAEREEESEAALRRAREGR